MLIAPVAARTISGRRLPAVMSVMGAKLTPAGGRCGTRSFGTLGGLFGNNSKLWRTTHLGILAKPGRTTPEPALCTLTSG